MSIPYPSGQSLRQLKTQLQGEVSRWELAQSNHKAATIQLTKAEQSQAVIEEGVRVFQAAAASTQEKIHAAFTTVGTQALAAVFPDPYELVLRFPVKRGRTEAQLVLKRGEMELDPLRSTGGGVIDLTAFALRLSALRISQPAIRQVLLLDEPFRFVSRGYRVRVASLLRQLAQDHGVQIIMVTHHPELQDIGTVIDLEEVR